MPHSTAYAANKKYSRHFGDKHTFYWLQFLFTKGRWETMGTAMWDNRKFSVNS